MMRIFVRYFITLLIVGGVGVVGGKSAQAANVALKSLLETAVSVTTKKNNWNRFVHKNSLLPKREQARSTTTIDEYLNLIEDIDHQAVRGFCEACINARLNMVWNRLEKSERPIVKVMPIEDITPEMPYYALYQKSFPGKQDSIEFIDFVTIHKVSATNNSTSFQSSLLEFYEQLSPKKPEILVQKTNQKLNALWRDIIELSEHKLANSSKTMLRELHAAKGVPEAYADDYYYSSRNVLFTVKSIGTGAAAVYLFQLPPVMGAAAVVSGTVLGHALLKQTLPLHTIGKISIEAKKLRHTPFRSIIEKINKIRVPEEVVPWLSGDSKILYDRIQMLREQGLLSRLKLVSNRTKIKQRQAEYQFAAVAHLMDALHQKERRQSVLKRLSERPDPPNRAKKKKEKRKPKKAVRRGGRRV